MDDKPFFSKFSRHLVPNVGTIVIVIALLWAQQAGAFGLLSPQSTSTTTISYQGRLADSGGVPITNTLGMTFRIYNIANGGSPLWTETYPGVQISDGLFHVLLGGTTPLPESLFAQNDTLYLGITVGADSEMTPREQLASSPYAMKALTVPDGSITQAKLGNDISFLTETSGTYVSTLTVTEGTNPTITPNTVTLTYKRIGSIVFVSVPLFFTNITGNPHVISWSLPFPPEVLDRGGEGSIYYSGGFTTGVIDQDKMAFREWGAAGFPTGSIPIRGGFWYIAAP